METVENMHRGEHAVQSTSSVAFISLRSQTDDKELDDRAWMQHAHRDYNPIKVVLRKVADSGRGREGQRGHEGQTHEQRYSQMVTV